MAWHAHQVMLPPTNATLMGSPLSSLPIARRALAVAPCDTMPLASCLAGSAGWWLVCQAGRAAAPPPLSLLPLGDGFASPPFAAACAAPSAALQSAAGHSGAGGQAPPSVAAAAAAASLPPVPLPLAPKKLRRGAVPPCFIFMACTTEQ